LELWKKSLFLQNKTHPEFPIGVGFVTYRECPRSELEESLLPLDSPPLLLLLRELPPPELPPPELPPLERLLDDPPSERPPPE
jgi:hypothetical protein